MSNGISDVTPEGVKSRVQWGNEDNQFVLDAYQELDGCFLCIARNANFDEVTHDRAVTAMASIGMCVLTLSKLFPNFRIMAVSLHALSTTR